MNVHVHIAERSFRFSKFDRLTIKGRTYRYIGKEKRAHILQLVTGDVVEDQFVHFTDRQLGDLYAHRKLSREENFFALAERRLKIRRDDSDLHDLGDRKRIELHWRHRWVEQFLLLESRNGNDGLPRIGRSPDRLAVAIDHMRDTLQNWHRTTFESAIERLIVHATMPVPSASTLYGWINRYEKGGYRIGALRDRRKNCGNRNQLRPEAKAIIEREIRGYCHLSKPKVSKIVKRIHDAIDLLNLASKGDPIPRTSPRIIRERIAQLAPFEVKAGREGREAAVRWFSLVGRGVASRRPLERVEIDDWESDIHVLLATDAQVRTMSDEELRKVPRVRCTVSIAIDCATSAVVGFNLSHEAPSSATSIATLKSLSTDKASLAKWAKCESSWPMHGRPDLVVTDKGSAFRNNDFEDVVRMMGSGHSIPDADPRKRGHVERFFGTLKDDFLSDYSGRTQSNVVEKGDYDSEAMASVTLEQFHRDLIQWIVNEYHQAPHTALEGSTPFAAWNRLAYDDEGIAPALCGKDIARIFGFHLKRSISREGIVIKNLYYNSEDVGFLLRTRANRVVHISIDPDDLGRIYLRVPAELRDHDHFVGREFVEVPCLDENANGVRLANWLYAQEETRMLVEADAEAGRFTRIRARADLYQGGLDAMLAARIPSHLLTPNTVRRIVEELDRNGRAALQPPSSRKAREGDSGELGQLAARSSGETRNHEPRRRRKTKVRQETRTTNVQAPPLQASFENDDSDLGSDEL